MRPALSQSNRGIKYLEFILNEEDRKPDPERGARNESRSRNAASRNISELRAMLGMITFHSQFVPDMKTLEEAMNHLLKKDVEFEWSEKCDENFQKVKRYLQSDLLLSHYDPNSPIIFGEAVSADLRPPNEP